MIVKLLTEHHLDFLSLKGGCRGLSESTLVKMSGCGKEHVTTHVMFNTDTNQVPGEHCVTCFPYSMNFDIA